MKRHLVRNVIATGMVSLALNVVYRTLREHYPSIKENTLTTHPHRADFPA
jgi:uncharacterized protein with HEPN domain